jgi:hypothetical protein
MTKPSVLSYKKGRVQRIAGKYREEKIRVGD